MTDYEIKFIKFYEKFSLDGGSAKEKLSTWANELEHAYTLSLSENGTDSYFEDEWEKIQKNLLRNTSSTDHYHFQNMIRESLHGKHKTTIEKKYLSFFFIEYNRIKKNRL
ncbi:hypothetical protein ACFO3O_20875 [Dokdonia ponticola]|uniref:Uncharacterized protein n=1 Tax=Dokdonia ponticola TaxID=2041041 RepID=A0ABV9I2P8_9FLAO